MTEHTVHFSVGSLQLEGLLSLASGDKGLVIAHPHPLYGGDLHNNVVETLARVYRQHGFTTLRFNFRGVGGSQGSYDEGEGEQEDIKAAVDYLLDQGKIRLDLAAYSFGAWVSALARTAQDKVQRLILVAPPVDFCDFHNVRSLPKLSLVITGERDEFAPPAAIARLLPNWNPAARLEIIPGADHFYGAHTRALAAIVDAYLA